LNQGLFVQMWKYSEARAITWGAGSIQGAYPTTDWHAFAHAKFLVRNPERFPGKIYSSIFPMNLSASARLKLTNQIAGGIYRAVVIHLSEGTDAAALNEFYTWQGWGMLDSTTVIIHGIPYGPAEFTQMAAAGVSLVWSPRSNLQLYGATANIPAAMAAGVPVSLGVDWCVSGSKGILQELSVADSLNQTAFGNSITDQQLVEMVTVNPARALGRASDLGRIAPGYLADFTVVSPGPGSAVRALIEATPHDVRLVMVEGRALYGIETLMDALHPAGDELEPFYLCDGIQRRIQFHLDDAGVPSSDQTLEQTEGLLLAAYANLQALAPCQTTGVRPEPVRSLPLFLDASPVPFSDVTTIFVTRSRGRTSRADASGNSGSPGSTVRVSVYDVAGRQVRVLFEGSLPAGGGRFTWDGRDRRGERVSSGVYFVQAVAGRERMARSVVLLR